jgi:uncharacterized protein
MEKASLQKLLVQAMKQKQSLNARVYKTVLSQVNYHEKLGNVSIPQLIRKEIKKRDESAQMFKSNNRMDLYLVEEEEKGILKQMLPAEMSEDEVKGVIKDYLEKNTYPSVGLLLKELKGFFETRNTDFKEVAEMAKIAYKNKSS